MKFMQSRIFSVANVVHTYIYNAARHSTSISVYLVPVTIATRITAHIVEGTGGDRGIIGM